jgi:hypothetical protein
MKTKLMITAIAMFFVMAGSAAMAKGKYQLSYKMEKGKTYRYVQDNTLESTREMGGQEMKFNADGHNITRFLVEDVSSSGLLILLYSYEEYKMHTRGMGKDTTMDMKGMVDKKVRVELSKLGKVEKETTIDSGKVEGRSFAMKFMGGSHFPLLPENQVGTGDKWLKNSTDTSEMEEGQTITRTKVGYTLAGKEAKANHNCLRIDFKGTLETSGKMKQTDLDLVLKGSGEISGTIWFDPSAGLMIEEQTTTSMEMTMALSGQAQMTIPVSQKITSKQSLLE